MVADRPVIGCGHVGAVTPRLPDVVVDDDVDRLARLPVRARERNGLSRRVVGLIADDPRREELPRGAADLAADSESVPTEKGSFLAVWHGCSPGAV